MTFSATRHVLGTVPPNVPSDLTRVWVMGSPDGDVLYVEPPGVWESAPFNPRALTHFHEWEEIDGATTPEPRPGTSPTRS